MYLVRKDICAHKGNCSNFGRMGRHNLVIKKLCCKNKYTKIIFVCPYLSLIKKVWKKPNNILLSSVKTESWFSMCSCHSFFYNFFLFLLLIIWTWSIAHIACYFDRLFYIQPLRRSLTFLDNSTSYVTLRKKHEKKVSK